MAKIQVTFFVSEEDIQTQVVDVGATSVLSTVVPASPGGQVHTLIEVVSGAVHVIAGKTPTATASAGLRIEAGDAAVSWNLASGFKVAAIEAAGGAHAVPVGAVIITPGTPVTPGKAVFIACTGAGNVRLKLANGSILDVPVNPGPNHFENIGVQDVVAANTTATVVVSVLA